MFAYTGGLKGDDGAAGAQGDAGVKGDQGDQGIQGVKGDPGSVFTSQFAAHRTAAQAIAASTWTQVEFNVEDWDDDAEYSHDDTYLFVAKTTGRYHIGANVTINSVADTKDHSIAIKKNGTDVVLHGYLHVGSEGVQTCHAEGDIDLTANDYLEVQVRHTDTVSRDTSTGAGCMFFGHRTK